MTESGGWHDAETNLFGPRAWAAILGTESARCLRYRRDGTVVIVEVVGFEALDSVWGQEVAPPELATIGAVLRGGARSSDYVARLGPRRFGILLPETNEVAAVNFVERVREDCTAAARRVDAAARCAFGWADATRDRPLIVAAEVAIARLLADARGG
jgi:diguanylate cyclase (GGDEF)-like protein